MAFWFAVDQINLKVVTQMMSIDLDLRYIAVLAMEKTRENAKKYRKKRKVNAEEQKGSSHDFCYHFEGGSKSGSSDDSDYDSEDSESSE